MLALLLINPIQVLSSVISLYCYLSIVHLSFVLSIFITYLPPVLSLDLKSFYFLNLITFELSLTYSYFPVINSFKPVTPSNSTATMVSLTTVRESNARFQSEPSKVALFVGATSGIGEATLKHFVKNAQAPTVYIVCRSKEAALPQLEMVSSPSTLP